MPAGFFHGNNWKPNFGQGRWEADVL
jgi:hypothetical protein